MCENHANPDLTYHARLGRATFDWYYVRGSHRLFIIFIGSSRHGRNCETFHSTRCSRGARTMQEAIWDQSGCIQATVSLLTQEHRTSNESFIVPCFTVPCFIELFDRCSMCRETSLLCLTALDDCTVVGFLCLWVKLTISMGIWYSRHTCAVSNYCLYRYNKGV